MSDGRSQRWADHRRQRRAEFVTAARAAAASHGPDVTLDQIADQASVTRTKIYRHFADVAELRAAVAEEMAGEVATDIESRLLSRDTPRAIIRGAVGSYVDFMVANENAYLFASRSERGTSERVLKSASTQVAESIGEFFGVRLSLLGLDPGPAHLLAHAVVGMVESATENHLAGDPDPVALTDQLAQWVWDLIAATLQRGGVQMDPEAPIGELFDVLDALTPD